MGKIFITSDLHFGHKSILTFQPNRKGTTVEEHDEWLIDSINSVVSKRDVLWILGDVAFNSDAIKLLKCLNGSKFIVLGNHDKKQAQKYLEYVNNVFGLVKKYGFWLSHAPIHPGSLRGLPNLHGHTHSGQVTTELGGSEIDPRYFNVGVDQNDGKPFELEQIRELIAARTAK